MPIVVPQIGAVIPDGISNLESFRQWVHSDSFPDEGRFAFLSGKVWMDLTMEQIYTHNRLKTEIAIVLGGIVRSEDLGQFFSDGVFLSHSAADLGNEPDALYVSYSTLQSGAIRQIPGSDNGCVEFVGTPDMVLEVVSKSSVQKDTVELPDLYWRAGIPEYWLLDGRGDTLRFEILSWGKNGYVIRRPDADGWIASTIFARSFRLTRTIDQAGDPKFNLELGR